MTEIEYKQEINRIKAKRADIIQKMSDCRQEYILQCSPYQIGDVVINNGHIHLVNKVKVNDMNGEFIFKCRKMRHKTWEIVWDSSITYETGRGGYAYRLRKIGHIYIK